MEVGFVIIVKVDSINENDTKIKCGGVTRGVQDSAIDSDSDSDSGCSSGVVLNSHWTTHVLILWTTHILIWALPLIHISLHQSRSYVRV